MRSSVLVEWPSSAISSVSAVEAASSSAKARVLFPARDSRESERPSSPARGELLGVASASGRSARTEQGELLSCACVPAAAGDSEPPSDGARLNCRVVSGEGLPPAACAGSSPGDNRVPRSWSSLWPGVPSFGEVCDWFEDGPPLLLLLLLLLPVPGLLLALPLLLLLVLPLRLMLLLRPPVLWPALPVPAPLPDILAVVLSPLAPTTLAQAPGVLVLLQAFPLSSPGGAALASGATSLRPDLPLLPAPMRAVSPVSGAMPTSPAPSCFRASGSAAA